MARDTAPVLDLARVRRRDVAVAGGKGANLGELVAAGIDVPPGFVVTTAAYDAYVETLGIRDEIARLAREGSAADVRALFAPAVPDALRDPIARACEALGGAVAVRSSATAEDLADASFAGQQDTYLNVRGSGDVVDAVRRCWASLWTDRALDYRRRRGLDPSGLALAVVVQTLAPADAAGVMFTANPANGRRDETVVDAAFGLGEAIVGGDVTPDEVVVRGGAVVSREVGDKRVMTTPAAGGTRAVAVPADRRTRSVLDDAEAIALAGLGARVQDVFGAPQDIEWVRADGGFLVVQSRPITALPDPVGPVPTDWGVPRGDTLYIRASIVEQLPDPLSPLFADLIRPAVRASLNDVFERFVGARIVRPGEIDFVTVNGFAYYAYRSALMGRLLLATPAAIPKVLGTRGGVRAWREEGHPAYARLVASHRDRDVSALSAPELVEGAAALVEAGARYYTSVQAVIPVAATSETLFTAVYDRLRRDGDPPATTFLLGFDSEPIRAERSLFELAGRVRAHPELAAALRGGRALDGLAGREEFDAGLAAHLAAFGHMTYTLDTASPVPADDPGPVLAALRYYLGDDVRDPRERQRRLVADREAARRDLLRRLDPVRRRLVERLLAWAQDTGPVREDALADIGLGWPAARRHLGELGRRLVAAGAIDDADDVHWLTLDEARAAAAALAPGRALESRSAAVARRREQWRGRRLADPPDWLPRGGWERVFRPFMPSASSTEGDVLTGLGASSGRAQGPARVLRSPEDFPSMRPGDVLVAPITTPAYTPLFALASAVVTDVGGPLSHSSIVAREYAVPAVLGTGSATRRVVDGDRLDVDGDRGRVLLPGARDDPPAVRPRRRRVGWALAAGAVATAVAVAWVRRPRRDQPPAAGSGAGAGGPT